MGKLVIVCNGESVWDSRNLLTGWVDVALTGRGIQEAAFASRIIGPIAYDAVYTSNLVRTIQTSLVLMLNNQDIVTPIIESHGFLSGKRSIIHNDSIRLSTVKIKQTWRLNERFFGKMQGYSIDQIVAQYGIDNLNKWRYSYYERPHRGESLVDVERRVRPFLRRKILSKMHLGKNVLVVSHNSTVRAMIRIIENLSPEEAMKLDIRTSKPFIYEFSSGKPIRLPLPKIEERAMGMPGR